VRRNDCDSVELFLKQPEIVAWLEGDDERDDPDDPFPGPGHVDARPRG
jgi:hypothetical protein